MKTSTDIEKQTAYQSTKKTLDDTFAKGGIPNIKNFKKIIHDLKSRIKLLETGTEFFTTSTDDVNKAAFLVARLRGQLQAYQERYNWIQERLKSAEHES